MDNIVALENMQCELELQMINQSIESDFMCNMINMYESYFLGNINELNCLMSFI